MREIHLNFRYTNVVECVPCAMRRQHRFTTIVQLFAPQKFQIPSYNYRVEFHAYIFHLHLWPEPSLHRNEQIKICQEAYRVRRLNSNWTKWFAYELKRTFTSRSNLTQRARYFHSKESRAQRHRKECSIFFCARCQLCRRCDEMRLRYRIMYLTNVICVRTGKRTQHDKTAEDFVRRNTENKC